VDNSPSVDDVEPCEWTGGVYRQGLLYSNQESTPKSVLNNAPWASLSFFRKSASSFFSRAISLCSCSIDGTVSFNSS